MSTIDLHNTTSAVPVHANQSGLSTSSNEAVCGCSVASNEHALSSKASPSSNDGLEDLQQSLTPLTEANLAELQDQANTSDNSTSGIERMLSTHEDILLRDRVAPDWELLQMSDKLAGEIEQGLQSRSGANK